MPKSLIRYVVCVCEFVCGVYVLCACVVCMCVRFVMCAICCGFMCLMCVCYGVTIKCVTNICVLYTLQNGQFLLTDKKSSNGTMVYLQDPLPLSYSVPMKLRMGRTTLSVQAKRGWTSTIRSALGRTPVTDSHDGPTAGDLHNILIETRNIALQNKREHQTSTNNNNNDNTHNNQFLTQRSYTIKTNNDNSVDGGEVDAEYLFGVAMEGGAGGGHSPRDTSPARLRVHSSGSVLSNISEGGDSRQVHGHEGTAAPHRSQRSPRNSGSSPRNSNRVRSRSNDSPSEGNSPRGSMRHRIPQPSHTAAQRAVFAEVDEDVDADFQLAIQASLVGASIVTGQNSHAGSSKQSSKQDTALQSPAVSSHFRGGKEIRETVYDEVDEGAEGYYTLGSTAEDDARRAVNRSPRVYGNTKNSTIVSSSNQDYSVEYIRPDEEVCV